MALTNSRRHILVTAVIVVATLSFAGCGRTLAPVKGKVTLEGQPVGPGTIVFIPKEINEDRPSAMATFGPDGGYELKTGDAAGAVVGEHQVIIQAAAEGEESDVASPIPLKYASPETGGLTATVSANGEDINFDLTR